MRLLVAAAAALVFALWLRARYYVLLGDGIALAALLFLIYLFVASLRT
ncbi:MAG: hypothetical protein LBV60_14575 [Streptomyces sp.]|nr:hypothetical protein [Streptomyces sp.]